MNRNWWVIPFVIIVVAATTCIQSHHLVLREEVKERKFDTYNRCVDLCFEKLIIAMKEKSDLTERELKNCFERCERLKIREKGHKKKPLHKVGPEDKGY